MPARLQSAAPALPLPKEAEHIGLDDVPFVTVSDKVALQLLQVDLTQGLWVVRTRFQPGYQIETHRHTGPVFAVTEKGRWFYREYPQVVNGPGSYLFEPAGSVHTLMTPADQTGETQVWFAIYGANINLDDKGAVTGVLDAATILQVYRALCGSQGLDASKVIVHGA
ncbi:MAG TPA: cupin [Alphaproteobacteria bacterium]|nr:cupin [Alphaproteobacteria bacterium]HAJ46885.1 cupin [Alphaproteobacteria bacterium]